jgi:hypothetical protein
LLGVVVLVTLRYPYSGDALLSTSAMWGGMGERVPVRVGDAEFYVEVSESGGPQTVGLNEALSLDGVRDTVQAIASTLGQVWKEVRPNEATVEFGLSLTAKSGKLTGILVDGEGQASLTITLVWQGDPSR